MLFKERNILNSYAQQVTAPDKTEPRPFPGRRRAGSAAGQLYGEGR